MHLVSRRRLLACLMALVVVSTVPQAAGAITANRQRALEGSSYVAGEQRANGSICAFSCIGSTADAVTALVAARTAPGVVKTALARWKLPNEDSGGALLLLRDERLIRFAPSRPWPQIQRLLIAPHAEELLDFSEAVALVDGHGLGRKAGVQGHGQSRKGQGFQHGFPCCWSC